MKIIFLFYVLICTCIPLHSAFGLSRFKKDILHLTHLDNISSSTEGVPLVKNIPAETVSIDKSTTYANISSITQPEPLKVVGPLNIKTEDNSSNKNVTIESVKPPITDEIEIDIVHNQQINKNITTTNQQIQFFDEIAEMLTQLIEPLTSPHENFTQIPSTNKSTSINNNTEYQHQTNYSLTTKLPNIVGTDPQNSQIIFKDFRSMIEQLIAAEKQVQIESEEIRRNEDILIKNQRKLDELSNNVRILSTALFTTQQIMDSAVLSIQASQLQLATHDQLANIAHQTVDTLLGHLIGDGKKDTIDEMIGKFTIQDKEFLTKLGYVGASDLPSLRRKKREANFNYQDELNDDTGMSTSTAEIVSKRLSDTMTTDEINSLVKVLSNLNGS